MPAAILRRITIAFGCALAVLPAIAHDGPHAAAPPDGPAITSNVLVGPKDHRYTSVPHWCQLPQGREHLGITHPGLAIDKAGRVYITTDDPPAGILVYGPDGNYIRRIAEKLPGLQGLLIHDQKGGQKPFYAVDLPGRKAVKLNEEGEVIWTIPIAAASGQYPEPPKCNPTGIAVAPNGDVYVADGYGDNRIHQFSGKEQKYIRSFGGKGKEPGKFQTCRAIAIDQRAGKPTLIVCDQDNRRLQQFDLDGTFLAVVAEGLRRPCAIAFHETLAAVAELEGRITLLDEHYKQIATLAEPVGDAGATKESIFNAPHGVAFDKDGNLYVADWCTSGRIVRLNK